MKETLLENSAGISDQESFYKPPKILPKPKMPVVRRPARIWPLIDLPPFGPRRKSPSRRVERRAA